jgi:hypothetical protein
MLAEAGFRRPRVTSRGCDPFEVWRALRGPRAAAQHGASGGAAAAGGEGNARVARAYSLNAAIMSNGATRAAKAALNAALGAARLGDSIRIRAEK